MLAASIALRSVTAGPGARPFFTRAAVQVRSQPSPLLAAATWQALPRTAGVRMQNGFADKTVVEKCTAKINGAIEVQELDIKGAYDDPNGSHITIYCVSPAFEGKRSLARQQMVFKVRDPAQKYGARARCWDFKSAARVAMFASLLGAGHLGGDAGPRARRRHNGAQGAVRGGVKKLTSLVWALDSCGCCCLT